VAVLLGAATRRVFLEVDVQGLGEAVDRLDKVLAEGLRAVVEAQVLALDDPRHGAQALELFLEAVLPLDCADEDPILLAAVVRLFTHGETLYPR
jgi:hypothetical protein